MVFAMDGWYTYTIIIGARSQHTASGAYEFHIHRAYIIYDLTMELPRNDLHLTTTGVGHAFRTGQPFPPPNIQVLLTCIKAVVFQPSYFSLLVINHFQKHWE